MFKRYILIFLITYIVVVLFAFIVIPLLKKIKAQQQILSYVKEHSSKNGTPTMGGLFFIMPFLIISLLSFKNSKRIAVLSVIITFAYMTVGFLDDYIKIKNKRNLGLKAYQKIVFQLSIAVVTALFCYKIGLTKINIPFTRKSIDLKYWSIPLIIIVFLATTNTVNLTDGLDGLAGVSSLVYLAFIFILCLLQRKGVSFFVNSTEYENLLTSIVVMISCISAFLLFNTFKASVFMGDTGSLALGGFIACVSIFTNNALYILIIGIVFVFSGLSVILQVVFFKITKGKRIFLMAPFHHHLQHKGLSESKIVAIYSAVTFIMGLISIFNYV